MKPEPQWGPIKLRTEKSFHLQSTKYNTHWYIYMGFPVVKNLPANTGDIRDMGSVPGSGRSPGGGHGNPLQYFCLENPQGQSSPTGYSPWGHKESDVPEATQHACTQSGPCRIFACTEAPDSRLTRAPPCISREKKSTRESDA